MAQALTTSFLPSLSLVSNRNRISISKNFISFPSPTMPKFTGIKFARVGGVEIPNNKRVEFLLQHIHGIGRTRAKQILYDLSMENKVTKDLSEEELINLRQEVSKYMIEGELRKFNFLAIERLKGIECYRGLRHKTKLPCRGQRTKNNCRTLKGRRPGYKGKKKAPPPPLEN